MWKIGYFFGFLSPVVALRHYLRCQGAPELQQEEIKREKKNLGLP